jgi:enoyl-CoA hydratase
MRPLLLARGFLNGVLTDADVAGEALARARRIAALAPQAARLNKQTFRALNQLLIPASMGHRMLWNP